MQKYDLSSQNFGGIMQRWQMQEAKAKMSEVVKCAQQGPQEITVHGEPVAVLVSRATFERLSHNRCSLLEFMQQSPLHGLEEIEFERDSSQCRDVAL